ncbi:hypothetical protein, partial [Sphingobium algorifonticola]|uniref:hypothetical protein n=1 Tax=Sphingobium algorifonticola TaxID=2008318 RepID=UPI0019D0858C
HKRVGRSCMMEASHPTRLCRSGSTNIKPADSRYDRGTSGGQVSQYKGAFHVFNSAVFLPESKHVYARIDQMFDRLQSEVVP